MHRAYLNNLKNLQNQTSSVGEIWHGGQRSRLLDDFKSKSKSCSLQDIIYYVVGTMSSNVLCLFPTSHRCGWCAYINNAGGWPCAIREVTYQWPPYSEWAIIMATCKVVDVRSSQMDWRQIRIQQFSTKQTLLSARRRRATSTVPPSIADTLFV